MKKKLLDKIYEINNLVKDLGIDAKIETRKSAEIHILIHEVGFDVGDEVFAVFDNAKEAEEYAERCHLYNWRIEKFKLYSDKLR